MLRSILLALLVVVTGYATGADFIVPGDFPTIQQAIDAAADGDLIQVKPGVYRGEGNRNIEFRGKAITLRSEQGSGSCIIDCEGEARGFIFREDEQRNTILDGFTIVNGYADGNGGGILCENASPTIINVVVTGCRSRASGGGIAIDGSPRIVNAIISRNIARNTGGGLYLRGASPVAVHCTIVDNSAASGGGVFVEHGVADIANSILWGNNGQGPSLAIGTEGRANIGHSNLQGGQAAVHAAEGSLGWSGGNMAEEPVFVLEGDYRLQPDSPCVDSAYDRPAGGLPMTDIDGGPRSVDGRFDLHADPDMGAHEFNMQRPAISLSPVVMQFTAPEGGPDPFGEPLSIANGGGSQLNYTVEHDIPWLSVAPAGGSTTYRVDNIAVRPEIAGLTGGVYTGTLRIKAEGASNPLRLVIVRLRISTILRVPEEYPTIQAAIDAAGDGDEIIVADGTYTGPGNRELDFKGKGIRLRSANGPRLTIIDCEGEGRGVYFHRNEQQSAVLEGFTIRNGYVPASWPQLSLGGGIVIESSSPTITNNIITANRGSGILITGNSSPIIRNNMIVDNIADWGGCGISCEGPTSPLIIGNTIAGNPGGGIRAWQSQAVVINCILWDNGEEIGGVVPSYSCVKGGSDGPGCIPYYPHFVDPHNGDYRLRSYSPCLDAGDNTEVSRAERDIDGSPRIRRRYVDIGAHESPLKSADTDNDNLPDDWETHYFGHLEEHRWDDSDGDGMSNLQEYRAGTNPIIDQRVVFVSAANVDDAGADGTEARPFTSIQRAVDAATEEVRVAEGCYRERILVGNKTLEIVGGYNAAFTEHDPAAYPTIIDADGLYRGVTFVNVTGGIIRGFTITGGDAYHGGGICVAISSVTIKNNIIEGNTARCGGAIEGGWNSNTKIIDNVIRNNNAEHFGGAIYLWNAARADIAGTAISGNSAGAKGGGVSAVETSRITIADSTLADNGDTGPISLAGSATIAVSGSVIQGGRDKVDAPEGTTLNWGDGNTAQ